MIAKRDDPAGERPTYADIEALPEHVVGEIIAGELVVSPRPRSRHAAAVSAMLMQMGPFHARRGTPGGWIILVEPEIRLGDPDYDTIVPDLAGWRRERMPVLLDTAAISIAPDWVCEVLSPSNALRDRARKMPYYARVGVGWAWIVEPTNRTIEVSEQVDGRWVDVATFGGDTTVAIPPFEAVPFDLELLWQD